MLCSIKGSHYLYFKIVRFQKGIVISEEITVPFYSTNCDNFYYRGRSPPSNLNFKNQIGGKKMEDIRPKRRKDKYNPYTIYSKEGHYYIEFRDRQRIQQNIEIEKTIYELFDHFELQDISQLNKVDRHIEHSELYEETLNMRSLHKQETTEEMAFYNIQTKVLYKYIRKLPEIQGRRLYLYYFCDMTYEQIADMEGCKHPAVMKSVKVAIKKLKKIFLEQGYNLPD